MKYSLHIGQKNGSFLRWNRRAKQLQNTKKQEHETDEDQRKMDRITSKIYNRNNSKRATIRSKSLNKIKNLHN